MKFLLKEKFEQLKKMKMLKEYTVSIKENFLSEELYTETLNSIQNEINTITAEIRKIQG